MKFDRQHLQITAAIAGALLTGACQASPDNVVANRNTAVCTNKAGVRVDDKNCDRRPGGASSAFMWYYLGRNASVPYMGDRAAGGSFTRSSPGDYYHAPASTAMTRSAAISRGGLGSSAHGFSGSSGS